MFKVGDRVSLTKAIWSQQRGWLKEWGVVNNIAIVKKIKAAGLYWTVSIVFTDVSQSYYSFYDSNLQLAERQRTKVEPDHV